MAEGEEEDEDGEEEEEEEEEEKACLILYSSSNFSNFSVLMSWFSLRRFSRCNFL